MKMAIESKFPQRFYQLRKSLNLSQSEMAKSIHISQAAVSRMEKGKQKPRLNVIRRISLIYKVRADYLLGLID